MSAAQLNTSGASAACAMGRRSRERRIMQVKLGMQGAMDG
jgi:hypothetical protein